MALHFDELEFLAAAQTGDFRKGLEAKRKLTDSIRRDRGLSQGEPGDVFTELTEIAARLLGIARVGLWALDDSQSKITCLDLYVVSTRRHANGTMIPRSAAPNYFEHVLDGGVIAANDARTDPRTAELADEYLPTHGIGALLDVPILIERQMSGVMCGEHVGGARAWKGWERLLASSIADCAGVAIETLRSASAPRWQRLAG
jgi:GAF domain-containing protein